MELCYAPTFIRMLKALSSELQTEAIEKIELLKERKYHPMLKVHKLRGRLKDRYSFSVNYKTRILFVYIKPKQTPCLLAIGDHDVYDV